MTDKKKQKEEKKRRKAENKKKPFVDDGHTIVGYTTRNSGGVPENFRNYFVIRFDKPFTGIEMTDDPASYKPGTKILKPEAEKGVEGNHAVMKVHFTTERGEQVNLRIASSFISPEQAMRNLQELGGNDFDAVKELAQARWDAKKSRNFALADELRQKLTALGWSVLDGKDGFEVKKI